MRVPAALTAAGLAAMLIAGCSAGAGNTAASPSSAPVPVFSCPNVRQIAELTAMAFTSTDLADATCGYATSSPAVQISVTHPAVAVGGDLAKVRATLAAGVQVQAAPTLAGDAFYATAVDGSCTAWAYARDRQVMSIRVNRPEAAASNPCDVARTVAVLIGTSDAPPTTAAAPSTDSAGTTRATTPTTTPAPTTSRGPGTTTTPAPDRPIFSTGPAAPFSLPARP